MPSKVTVTSKDFTATAVVGFDVGVGQEVSFKIRALIETAITHGTFVGRLLHMKNFMYG
jgi:hypothetical protein